MQGRGITMIDRIQGPPRWDGPEVLLRQTSFRALAEARVFREPDGTVAEGSLRVRFGEVEARGIALTPAGRELYDEVVRAADDAAADRPGNDPVAVAREVWEKRMPRTEAELEAAGLGWFTYCLADALPAGPPPRTLRELVAGGWAEARPVVYEDFLPRSAAGIFASNLSADGSADGDRGAVRRDAHWLAAAIGRDVLAPEDLYGRESRASVAELAGTLGITLTGPPA